uniref:Methyltransferase domain-containing protein n=1 Tax=Candidatus Kentrum sp. DK TaxID=2126562 RepID=A0A450RVK6_9GAMM|nr:MAG: Methyltransferase domain-containing protein [Candidatus Kentron sp. DK]
MFRFVTKKDYWDVLNSNILDNIKEKKDFSWHLKSIQDAIAFSYLHEFSGKYIAEIGGGNSRLLSSLAMNNTCFNIDEFNGAGGGPRKECVLPGVKNILARIGSFSGSIESEQFDAIFSISVVEHVPNEGISDFFNDSYRILKPSGLMIHLIDVYLEDAMGDNKYASRRVLTYGSFFNDIFLPLEPSIILTEKDVVFSTSFATNPDNMMERWNRSVPKLRNKRERAQSCSLLMVGTKTTSCSPP